MFVVGWIPNGGKIAMWISTAFLLGIWLSLFGVTTIEQLIAKVPYYKYFITASVGILVGNILVGLPFLSGFFPLGRVKEQ